MMEKIRSQLLALVSLAILWGAGLAMFTAVWRSPWFAVLWTTVVVIIAGVIIASAILAGSHPAETAVGAGTGARVTPGLAQAGSTSQRQRMNGFPSTGALAPPAHGTLVAIAGVGDIGSRVAVSLVQSGVGRLAVADIDTVEPGNIGQSSFRAIDVGCSKVEAIERICREINPAIEVRGCTADLGRVPELDLGMWIGGASLLVLAIDDPPALLRLHDLFYRRLPTISGGIHDRGVSGHVAYTIPGRTACLRCALGVTAPRDIVQVRGNTASPEDVQRIAGETASAVMALLDPARAAHLATHRNVLFISNRDSAGTAPYQSNWLEPQRNPGCRHCRGGPSM